MKFKILNSAILISASAFVTEAYAACHPTSGFVTTDISMAVGRVVVRPSDPVGTILRKATFPISASSSRIYCDYYGGTMSAKITQNLPLSPLGNSIYNTNIPGIGIRLYREAEGATNFSGYYPYTSRMYSGYYNLSAGYFVVEIIKTAENTGSGAIAPGRYSTYYADGYTNIPSLTSTIYGNAITIASSSCEVLGNINKTVNLPKVNKSEFQGVGSTAGEQGFNLDLKCNGGTNPSNYIENNRISLDFDYESTDMQTITNSATSSTRANGVNTQLVMDYGNQNTIVRKGSRFYLGTVNSGQSLQYNLPMRARYIKMTQNVTPGKVRGMATVTIHYE